MRLKFSTEVMSQSIDGARVILTPGEEHLLTLNLIVLVLKSMKVHKEIIQGSDQWLALRSQYFTASTSGKWVTAEKRNKTQEKAAFGAICKKLAEISDCEMKPHYEDWGMKRGTELEPEARDAYTEETGRAVEEVGFCSRDDITAGASPDGFINEREGMMEIKSPEPQTQVKYILCQDHLIEYCYNQVHHQMAVTGCKYVDLYSYCPGLPSVLVRIERDAFTEDLLRGLVRLSAEFKIYKKVMSLKWLEMKNRIEEEK